EVAKFDRLASDLVTIYATGDAEALRRIAEHYGHAYTAEDVRAMVWRQVYKVRQAKGAAQAFQLTEAQELIARTSGYPNWTELTQAVAKGVPPPGEAYAIDRQENRIGPRRNVRFKEWDAIIGVIQEQRIPAVDANGQMTDAALESISKLD